jgi:hypothetical protein
VAFAGSNKSQYGNLQSATVDIGGSTRSVVPNGQRVYINSGGTPSSTFSWPTLYNGDGTVATNARACVSIYPPLWELINPGTYPDLASELDNFLKGAPAGPPSLVGLWHEASGDNDGSKKTCGPNNDLVCRGPGGAYSEYFAQLDSTFPNQGGASGLLKSAQAYVQKRVRALNNAEPGIANVLVGAIEVVSRTDPSKLGSVLNPWMADNLDFYAADVYDDRYASAVPSALLDAFQKVVVGHMTNGLYPTIGIGETNSRFPGRRPFWFASVWSWLKSNGHTSDKVCFLTFWHHDGTESGDWIPDDWATIDVLYGICAESSP